MPKARHRTKHHFQTPQTAQRSQVRMANVAQQLNIAEMLQPELGGATDLSNCTISKYLTKPLETIDRTTQTNANRTIMGQVTSARPHQEQHIEYPFQRGSER